MPILDWMNKKQALTIAENTTYKVLVENKDLSYGDQSLIKGDNIEALKALLPYYKGQVKCIYIDPPYNTGNAFEHYDDNLQHSTWLSLMYPRLELLRELLSEYGSIFVQIDDEEQAYLKVIMDEIFGRENFVNMLSVNMKNIAGASGGGEDKRLKKNCEYILIYAKNYKILKTFNTVYSYSPISKLVEEYRQEGRSWKYTSVITNRGEKIYIGSTYDGEGNEIKIYRRDNYTIKSINQLMKENNLSEGDVYKKYAFDIFTTAMPQSSIRPRVVSKVNEIGDTGDLYSIEYVPKTGRNKGKLYEQFYKGASFRLFAWLKDVAEERDGELCKKDALGTYWDLTTSINNLTKEGNIEFPNGKKPEVLLSRILEMTTKEKDLILDSFLGSGTTCAVAQKMNRRYIGIEMGEQVITHCVPRLKKVIDGIDEGGISKSVNWKGGGGYTFYDLGNAIFDTKGNINTNIKFKDLAFHVWFSETKTPLENYKHSSLIGIFKGTAYYLLYNGILGDKRISGGNCLTSKLLAKLPKHNGKKIIYGEVCRLSAEKLLKENIIFKQTPYDIKAR